MEQETIKLIQEAFERAEKEAPEKLRHAKLDFARGMVAFFDVLLPFIDEKHRDEILQFVAYMQSLLLKEKS